MKTFRTLTPITLGAGKLALSPEQASIRLHALTELGDGLYEVVTPIQFKAGEVFGHDLPVPKALAACLEETDLPLEDQDILQLRILATNLGLKPGNTGREKLLEKIRARQEELQKEADQAKAAAEAKAARIAELEALTEPTDAEKAELAALKA